MKRNLASGSLLLFGLSILFLGTLTLFESALRGMPPGTERILTLVLLVLPGMVGCVLAVLSLRGREGRKGLAVSGLVLNSLFALFHLLIVMFAG
jgi:hypothetical protein